MERSVGLSGVSNASSEGASVRAVVPPGTSPAVTVDRYVVWRLHRLLVKKRGRNLRAGQANAWTSTWFHDQGLHQLMGTIRYPKAA
jgi:hypothetical protein